MLRSPIVEHPSKNQSVHAYAGHRTDAGLGVLQSLVERARDQKASRPSLFDRYIEGWAEADVDKILDGAAPSYRFTDPLVGSFSGRWLYDYFDLLQDRFSRAGAISRPDLAFFLCGPMERRSHVRGLQFWREAPRLGLRGVSEIEIAEAGVIAERAAYDLNLAFDVLCRPTLGTARGGSPSPQARRAGAGSERPSPTCSLGTSSAR
jgi:hypothetical protein